MKKTILLCAVIFAQCAIFDVHAIAQDKIVAIVNKDIITEKDLKDFISFMRMQLSESGPAKDIDSRIEAMKPDLVDKLIEDRLILQEAKRILREAYDKKNLPLARRLEPDRSRIKERLALMRAQYNSNAQFQQSLARQGFNEADIERRLEEQMLTRNIIDIKIRNSIVISPSEVTDFFESHRKEFLVPEERLVTMVAVSDPKLVNQVYLKAKHAADLEAIAGEYGLKTDILNFFKDQELRQDINEAVFELQIGRISRPVKVEKIFYIFRLDSVNPPMQQSLPEVQDRIYAYLQDVKMQNELRRWLDELRSKAYIKISTPS